MRVSCGIDWASDHHDVALVDHDGALVARARISDDTAGLQQLLVLLTDHGDSEDSPIPVAIETSRGLLVACLRATRRPVYAINPMAASRYRDRHAVARKKSDHLDAMVLANIRRTDRAAHRPLPNDSELAQAIAVLARAQQDAVWNRTQAGNKLRSHLREYFPGFLAAFQHTREGLCLPVARVVLAAAPTPAHAAKLTRAQLRSLLKKAGRQRGIDAEADRLHDAFRLPQMRQLAQVEQAMGLQALALLRQLEAACTSADDLTTAAVESFDTHPDAEIITSLPGLGSLTGARVLAEIGDDRSRFTDAKGLKAFAGAAPVTRASGKSLVVMARRVKNQRLAAVGYVWAFSALSSPGARAHYDRRREAGDRHTAAQRHLFNRLLGCLHHCLTRRVPYDETTAFPPPDTAALPAAA
ncbi:IS110 family transposase [Streptomyces sp. CB01635]|uniref:IS110 family transposase n=1 Tax=unclassified Streptomyces TaxID=2593676 RepID=UPI000C271B1F|nr:IS110 family transposase [Streptomyces sp. CB01635]PJN05443.1 IS110 family transposase [Streptomyces sp. CB01635]